MDVQKLVDDFNGVLEDAHNTGINLGDPISRAMIVSVLVRLIEEAWPLARRNQLRLADVRCRKVW